MGPSRATLTVAVGACAAVLALHAPGAFAQDGCAGSQTVPAGNSEVDQYAETVPDACGDRPVGGGEGDANAVPPGTAAELEALGDDGTAALELARSTAPRNGDRDAGGAAAEPDDGGLGDVADGIVEALGGSSGSGLGILLPLLMAGILVAGIAYARRRRSA
jgi:hypothetical protein